MDDRKIALRGRAQRAFGRTPIAEAVQKVRAIIGVPNVPESEAAAQAALDKLNDGETPTSSELAALELVIRLMRAAPLSRNGAIDPLPSRPGTSTYDPLIEDLWNQFRTKVKPFLYSIGRLDRTSGQDPEVGTGFLVAPGLVLTNRHVVDDLSYGAGALERGQAVVRFYQEFGLPDPDPDSFDIIRVIAVHPALDMALLEVDAGDRATLEFESKAATQSEPIAVVGYPFKDGRSPLFGDAIYGKEYGVKRAAIGEVMELSPDGFFHDCSTMGGNSGSPVFSLTSGRVVGLHFSGFFMYRNEAIGAAAIQAFMKNRAPVPEA